MTVAILNDLGENLGRDVGEGDGGMNGNVLDHVLNSLGFNSNSLVDLERLPISALEDDHLFVRFGGHGWGFGNSESEP